MKTIIDFTNKVKSLVDGRMSNIANVEESPSTHAYTVGKQLIFNGLLCKATSAIAVGDTLAVGTNLALSDNVVEQIYSLNQGLANSLNNLSHENLLDNPWFTVNQRGQSSYSGLSQYTVDRWHSANTLTVDVSTGMVDITNSSSYWGYFDQYLEESIISLIYGKTLTLSVLLEDGEILSKTGTMPSAKPSENTYMIQMSNVNGGMNYQFTYEQNTDKWRVSCVNRPNTHNTKKVRAVKLELGSISTLAMDTAPNYQQELAKCQRYYEQNKWYSWCVQANIDGFIDIMTTYPFLVQKRDNSITTNILKQNIGNGQLLDLTTSTFIPSSEITIAQPTVFNLRMENIKIIHNSITRGHTYYFSIGDDCIAFSADL